MALLAARAVVLVVQVVILEVLVLEHQVKEMLVVLLTF
jgi:hypothetical protein